MPHQHSHIPVESFSFLVGQHYLTGGKKKKKAKKSHQNDTSFHPQLQARECFMYQHSWNQLEFVPQRYPAWGQRGPTSLIRRASILKTKNWVPPSFHWLSFLSAGVNRFRTYLKSLCDAFWPTGLHLRYLLRSSLLITCLFHFRLGQLLLC